MEDAHPQLLVGAPLLLGVPEQGLGLRARVEVGRELVRSVDIEDRGDALDEVSIVLHEGLPGLLPHGVRPSR
jgi:hypothetical protein